MCLIHPSLRWGERDTSINSSASASMTELIEVKSTADRGVELEVKSQLDNDVSHSPVIEVGGERIERGSPYLRAYSCQDRKGGEECVRGNRSV
jgi:hypothetical protein